MHYLLVTFCTLVATAIAFPRFQLAIPNGESVPDPCNPGAIWKGVGHLIPGGTGPRNPFGLSFAAENNVWTVALCRADSDGDGKTNGEELGDPHCHWTANNNAHLVKATSHPGICEPVGSARCSGQTFKCN